MKIAAGQIANFLKQPPKDVAGVLIYGPDEGLVRERAETLTRLVLGGAKDDPFHLTILTGDAVRSDPARLADETQAYSLLGGRRVIRLREAGDAIAKTLAYVLDQPSAGNLLIVEAGDLGKASSLRRLAEAAPKFAVIACYADGPRELTDVIKSMMAEHRISITDEAIQFLVGQLGGDRMITRQELEKLTLFAGVGGRIDLASAAASIGDSSALDLDAVLYDALDGLTQPVAAALSRLFLEGQAPITVLRAAQRHVHRLHLVGVQIASGQSPDQIISQLRPPLFFKWVERFRRQLREWPPERCQRLIKRLTQAELDCKQTGFPEEIICRQILTTAGYIKPKP